MSEHEVKLTSEEQERLDRIVHVRLFQTDTLRNIALFAAVESIIAARLADAEARAEAAEAKVARVSVVHAKYAGRSKWVGYEAPRREAWDEIERDLREALRGDQ